MKNSIKEISINEMEMVNGGRCLAIFPIGSVDDVPGVNGFAFARLARIDEDPRPLDFA